MPDPAARPAPGTLPPPVAAGPSAGDEFNRLVEIMRTLRSPDGCPWDRQQSLRTLAPYVLEEAAEVVDAIERDDAPGVCEEVGDLVFEGVFLAQVAAEAGQFTAADAVRVVCEKLIRRHPHVFAQPAPAGTSEAEVETASQVVDQWDRIKAREKAAGGGGAPRLLDAVPRSLAALATSLDIGHKVARVGFDWPTPSEVLDKIEEEIHELRAELVPGPGSVPSPQGPSAPGPQGPASSGPHVPNAPGPQGPPSPGSPPPELARVADELGDLLFSLAQLARKLDIDPEAALRAANRKFRRRFDALEDGVRADGLDLASQGLAALEARWQAVKAVERAQGTGGYG